VPPALKLTVEPLGTLLMNDWSAVETSLLPVESIDDGTV
jgi:hypothetical protein